MGNETYQILFYRRQQLEKKLFEEDNKIWLINLYFIQFTNGITVAFNIKNHKIIIMDYKKVNTQYKHASYKIIIIVIYKNELGRRDIDMGLIKKW